MVRCGLAIAKALDVYIQYIFAHGRLFLGEHLSQAENMGKLLHEAILNPLDHNCHSSDCKMSRHTMKARQVLLEGLRLTIVITYYTDNPYIPVSISFCMFFAI